MPDVPLSEPPAVPRLIYKYEGTEQGLDFLRFLRHPNPLNDRRPEVAFPVYRNPAANVAVTHCTEFWEKNMSTASSSMTKSQRIGLVVFITAIILTAIMFWMGATGTPLPRWVLFLTTVL
jgi:hypothetical protein